MTITTRAEARHPVPQLSAGRPFTPTVYVVGWRQDSIVKVGWTSGRDRWKRFVGRGAEVISLTFFEPGEGAGVDPETALHAYLSSAGYIRPFSCRADAAPYLGQRGAGWLECYRIAPHEWDSLPTGADFNGT